MKLKQRIKNHIVVSGFTSITTIVLFGAWWYFNYDPDILFIGGIFHLIFTIPALYLHTDYSIRNAGEEIEINYNEVIVRKKGTEQKYNINDLSKVILYKSASIDSSGIPLSAMEYYRYVRIFTKSGEEIIITCLMTLDIDEVVKQLPAIPYERKKGLAFLFWR